MAGLLRRLLRTGTTDDELVDRAAGTTVADEHARLRRIAAEAVILQDQAEDALRRVRARAPLGQVAPLAGPLVHRFFRLRDQLPTDCLDPADEQLRAMLDVLLHHHALLVATALDLLAYEHRSEHVAATVATMEIGEPGRRLDEIYARLAEPVSPPGSG
jgi:hypothetical protein